MDTVEIGTRKIFLPCMSQPALQMFDQQYTPRSPSVFLMRTSKNYCIVCRDVVLESLSVGVGPCTPVGAKLESFVNSFLFVDLIL